MEGGYLAAGLIVLIIIVLLVFFFAAGCSGGRSGGCELPECLQACRLCLKATSNQLQLGPCCEAKITNSVGQATTYTLPDPGQDAASFLLSVSSTPQTINGAQIVTSSGGAVTQSAAGAGVTLNSNSGLITTANLANLAAGATSTAFVVTNSAVSAGQLVLVSTNAWAGAANTAPTPFVTSVVAGAFTIQVVNAGNTATGTLPLTIAFLVVPV